MLLLLKPLKTFAVVETIQFLENFLISVAGYSSLIALAFIRLPTLILDIKFLNVRQAVFISDFGLSSKIQLSYKQSVTKLPSTSVNL